MKYHLILFLLFISTMSLVGKKTYPRMKPMFVSGNQPAWMMADGEYVHLILRHDSVFDGAQGIPVYIANHAVSIFCGAHGGGWIDDTGKAHTFGANGAGETGQDNAGTGLLGNGTINHDSLGNAVFFTDIQYGQTQNVVNGSFWWAGGLCTDSTVDVWGALAGGICGNGTYCALRSQAPVKVPLPVGEKAVQIQCGYYLLIRTLSGKVYAVGGGGGGIGSETVGHGGSPNFNVPVQLTLPSTARLIAGGGIFSYAVLDNGTLYAWGSANHLYYFTLPYGSSSQNTPRNITANLPFSPTLISEMAVNNDATYTVLSTGLLYGWGSNAQGTMGNGYELDFKRYGGYPLPYGTSNPFPYAYAQDYNEGVAGFPGTMSLVIQNAPINLTPGKTNWLHVHGNPCGYRYQQWVEDMNFNWYFMGRNKGSCSKGIMPTQYNSGAMQQRYSNAWDCFDLQAVNSFAQTTLYTSPSKDCLPSGTALWSDACGLYPGHTPRTPATSLLLSTAQIGGRWAVIVNMNGVSDAQTVMHCKINQAGGPHVLDLGIRDYSTAGSRKDTIYTATGANLVSGDTYYFHELVINNDWDSSGTNASITIPSAACGNCLSVPYNIKFVKNEKVFFPLLDPLFYLRERTDAKGILSATGV